MIVTFACANENCQAYGDEKPVCLEEIAPGLISFPYLVLCVACGLAVPIVDYVGVYPR